MKDLQVGDARVELQVKDGWLESIGDVRVGGVALRNDAVRFLPWFDSYQGDVFRRFRFLGVRRQGQRTVLALRAVSDPDWPFMERRDSSGDICLRNGSWDRPPQEADFRVVLEPAEAVLEGRKFAGLKYWFEYAGAHVPIHRLLDRQTWEIGGNLKDVTVVCRGLFDLPKKKVTRRGSFSTVGLDNWARLLPGNLWPRWGLLPAFDMQYGGAGILLAWFDRVSCIRTVIESTPGEDWIRHLDFHYFTQSRRVATNPKTILYCPDRIDDVDALNLWTAVHDQEHAKACRQFHIPREQPPAITFALNAWKDYHFDTTYESAVELAAKFKADYVFIDPVWENHETYRRTLAQLVSPRDLANSSLSKATVTNMCCSLDFEVAKIAGGEKGLKRLCRRAAAKGVKIISWMAAHYSPLTSLKNPAESPGKSLGHGQMHIFAAKESGRHPDGGAPGDAWPINLNAPIFEKVRRQVLGVCRRTGLAGYLWDSYSNFGWWQVDYSKGDMRPQFDRMAQLYADLVKAGLYVQPEGIVAFSNHSCCGLHGGNIYEGDKLGYAYNMVTSLSYPDAANQWADQFLEILAGRKPISILFRCFAHKWIPCLGLPTTAAEPWDPKATAAVQELFAVYKAVRNRMVKRVVLKGDLGVLWEDRLGPAVLFSFRRQRRPGRYSDAATGQVVEGDLDACRAYVVLDRGVRGQRRNS